jgi:hypothetical protein
LFIFQLPAMSFLRNDMMGWLILKPESQESADCFWLRGS